MYIQVFWLIFVHEQVNITVTVAPGEGLHFPFVSSTDALHIKVWLFITRIIHSLQMAPLRDYRESWNRKPFFYFLHPPPPHFYSTFSTDTSKDTAASEINFPNKHERAKRSSH